MLQSMFAIQKLRYKKVKLWPDCKPSPKSEFIYVGKGFKGKPELLEQYLKGGYAFSERRKAEINNKPKTGNFKRNSLYPDCSVLFNYLFPSFNELKLE